MTRRRALWLVVTLLTLAALSLLIPASPAYLPDLVSQGYFGVYHDGHSAGYWADELNSPDTQVRYHAINCLGAIGADAGDAVPALAAVMLDDPDPEARSRAALALSKMAPASRSAAPALAAALGDDEPFVRMNAATALFQLRPGAPCAVPALIREFQDERNCRDLPLFCLSIQEMMALALGRCSAGTVEGVPLLKAALEAATTPRRRVIMARALAEIGCEANSAAPDLRALLADNNLHVRRAAEEALIRIGEWPLPDQPAPAAPAGN
jgi:HEAT repeat protein